MVPTAWGEMSLGAGVGVLTAVGPPGVVIDDGDGGPGEVQAHSIRADAAAAPACTSNRRFHSWRPMPALYPGRRQ
ncbi:MAG: hypothetical protein WBX27_16105 [Specibacter sp.]